MSASSPFLAVPEVAELLGVSCKFVYKHKQEIPGFIRVAGALRWNRKILLEELDRLASGPGRRKSGL